MSAGPAKRRLPVWMADGPTVSDLAYRIVVQAFGDPPIKARASTQNAVVEALTNYAVVLYLADELDADEGDILTALAELQRTGVLVKEGET